MTSNHSAPSPPRGISQRHRRSVVVAPGRSRIDHIVPPTPAPGEITIEVIANGVCASDLPTWRTGPDASDPVTLGHEPIGRVVAVGPNVRNPAVGDLVTGRLVDSFADLILARAEDVVVVPPALPPEAAIGEPLGCLVEAVRRSGVDTGDRIAIIGMGFMGLCLLQLLAAHDVGDIIAVDTREESRQHALDHGASQAHEPNSTLADHLQDSVDVVFEVTGVQAGIDLATTLTRPHGTLSIVGYHQGARLVDMQAWNWKALDVVNGHVRDQRRLNDSIRRGLDLVAAGRVNNQSLITHRYPLEDLDKAFADLETKPPGFIKAVITLDSA
jgi:L-iditol 2-dehydrogenase